MKYTPVMDDQGRAACFRSLKFYELDEQSGLPKVLEKGSYFKVKRCTLPGTLEVHYMTRWGPFSFSEGYGFISNLRDREVTQSEILFETLWVLGEVEKARAAKLKPKPVKVKQPRPISQKRALGKYPPKRLKDL